MDFKKSIKLAVDQFFSLNYGYIHHFNKNI